MQATTRELRSVPFHAHTEIEIVEASTRRGCARIPARKTLTNHTGHVHGGMLYAIGEVTAAACMVGLLGDRLGPLHGVTRRGEIDYLKPARGEVRGEARAAMTREQILSALEGARSVDVPVEVTLRDTAGVTVATLAITWYVGWPR